MNGATHYLAGVIITLIIYALFSDNWAENKEWTQKVLFTARGQQVTRLFLLRILIIVPFSFYFHAVLDALANFTYHPSESDWGNTVYLVWHLTTYVAEFIFAVVILRKDLRYFWGMISAVGFDLWDWSTARPLHKYYGINLPTIHHLADSLSASVFFWTPNWRYQQWALSVEVVLVIMLTYLWLKIERKYPLPPPRIKGSVLTVTIIVLIFGAWRVLTLF